MFDLFIKTAVMGFNLSSASTQTQVHTYTKQSCQLKVNQKWLNRSNIAGTVVLDHPIKS